MSLADDLQVIAFHDVVTSSNGARLRQLYRWYSKTFFTPLHEVMDLSLPFILQAFWEERYSQMDKDELEEARLRLIKSEAELSAEEQQDEADTTGTEDLVAQLEAELADKAKPASVAKKIEDVKPPAPVKTREKIPEVNLPKPDQTPPMLPEAVKIQFADTDFFDELADRLDAAAPSEDPNLLGKSPRKR